MIDAVDTLDVGLVPKVMLRRSIAFGGEDDWCTVDQSVDETE